jgi:hypothetical protein
MPLRLCPTKLHLHYAAPADDFVGASCDLAEAATKSDAGAIDLYAAASVVDEHYVTLWRRAG